MTADSSVSEQLRALTSLQNLSLKLSATLTLDETLDAIVEAAMVICRADRAAISYINESGELPDAFGDDDDQAAVNNRRCR